MLMTDDTGWNDFAATLVVLNTPGVRLVGDFTEHLRSDRALPRGAPCKRRRDSTERCRSERRTRRSSMAPTVHLRSASDCARAAVLRVEMATCVRENNRSFCDFARFGLRALSRCNKKHSEWHCATQSSSAAMTICRSYALMLDFSPVLPDLRWSESHERG